MVTTDKALFFYEFTSSFKFEEEKGTTDKGIAIPDGILPTQILWNNDLLYIASKKCYMILSKKEGGVM